MKNFEMVILGKILFDFDLMDPQALYLQLLNVCRQFSFGCLDESAQNQIWSSLCDIAFSKPKTFLNFIPLIETLFAINPQFSKTTPQNLVDSINLIRNSEIELENRIQTSTPLFELFPFLPNEILYSLMDAIFVLFTDYFKIKQNFPSSIIQSIDNIEVASINHSQYTELLKYFKNHQNENLAAVSLFFAPISNSFIDNEPDSIQFAIDLFDSCMKSDNQFDIMAGLFLVERLSQKYSSNPNYSPSQIFEKVSSHLFDENSMMKYRSHKAMRRLIQSGLFETKEKVAQLVDQYPQYKDDQKNLFFKLMSSFLEELESVNLETVQPIFEFCLSNISQFDIIGYILSIFTSFAAISPDFIKDLQKAILLNVHQIVLQKKFHFFKDATEALFAISQCFGQEKIAIFEKDIHLIIESIASEDCTLPFNKVVEVYQSISTLPFISSTKGSILKFLENSYEKIAGNTIYPFCTTCISLSTELNAEETESLIKKLTEIGLKEDDECNRLYAILETVKKLLKQTKKLDETKYHQLCDMLCEKITSNQFQSFHSLPFIVSADLKSMMFHFISSLIYNNNSEASHNLLQEIIRFSSIVPSSFLTYLLEPIQKAEARLSIHECQQVASAIATIVPSFDLYSEENDDVISSLTVLLSILRRFPEVVDTDNILKALNSLIQVKTNDDEEEDDKLFDPLSIVTTYKLIVSLSLNAKEINLDVLSTIVEEMPITDDASSNSEIIIALAEMISENNQQRFEPLYLPILTLFANLAIETDPHKKDLMINSNADDKMKSALREAVRKDSTIERKLTKDFIRAKHNRFKAIVK